MEAQHTIASSPTAVKIIDAAARLFMQRGYSAVSITDIIKAAEITKPTLYYYFADKEELFVQMGLRVLEEMGERMRGAADQASGTAGKLQALAEVVIRDSTSDMRMMRHEMAEHVGPEGRRRLAEAFYGNLFAPIHQVMDQGLAAGRLARYPAPALAMMFLSMVEAFHGVRPETDMPAWLDSAYTPFSDTSQAAHTIVDLFLHGVGR